MRAIQRKLLRKKLDVEMRPLRRAGMEKNPTSGLLRAVRLALRIEVSEIAGKMGIHRSGVFELEARELTTAITLRTMTRMTDAMGCTVVYGIVPKGGRTLEELEEERMWA